jgi:hypothetical protein
MMKALVGRDSWGLIPQLDSQLMKIRETLNLD